MAAAGKKILVPVLAIVAVLAVYFVFIRKDNMQDESALPVENDSIYLSGLSNAAGEQSAMEEDKVVFLNVWATWCGPCNMEMPGIQKLYDKYKDNKKVAFYIVSDEDFSIVSPFIERKGYQLPFYRFAGSYPASLDGNAIPRTYIISKGKVLAQEVGASQWDRPEIIELIDKHIAEI
ncbi:MAG TPA: TlpA disulfide reductase family protein [Dyadobacter sp.]|jgi:thiol-disulfide isomerase/thioredoxin|nr:TlpA disulfide reductase family protein [Dyadobacter sp.]